MFGVSTFCLHDLPLSTALERIIAITDVVEVMDEGMHYLENAELLKSYTARFTLHAPSRGTNLASLLEPIRQASVEVMTQCFAIAGEVNASVVVHPGYFAWVEERERAEQQCRRSLAELSHVAQEFGITFFVENMGNWDYFLLKTPDELSLCGNVPFALDVGHAHQNNCLDEFLKHPAGHFHLHDNDGKEDTHSPVGGGTIDFPGVMNVVNRRGITPIIEVATFDGVVQSIETLKKF
jgi:sugar phosphate isomerase/epimerase